MRGSVVFCAVLLGAFFLTGSVAVPALANNEPAWERQAEDNFYLPAGTAGELMSKHEWEQHWKAMENMGPRHQSRYRREWHVKMMQRAQQRGINMPGMGGYHGGGKGMGMGQGGAGGKGMGTGQGGGGQSGAGGQQQGSGQNSQ